MVPAELLQFTKKGIYCPRANIYIDPFVKVDTAIITHAHSDHARRGSNLYICHTYTSLLLRHFFGKKCAVQSLEYGKQININDVVISLHPAGHVLGSAQVRIEYKGTVVVIAGDYKVEADNVSEPFIPVPCDIFVTESTFAKPLFDWKPQAIVMELINSWWKENQKAGKLSIILAYSLGKSQRILKNIDSSIGEILVTEQIDAINKIHAQCGVDLPETTVVDAAMPESYYAGKLLISSSGSLHALGLEALEQKSVAQVSGWIANTYMPLMRGIDKGFIISDHADWKGLLATIEQTNAKTIFVQHGYTNYLTNYLRSIGKTAFDVTKEIKLSNNTSLF